MSWVSWVALTAVFMIFILPLFGGRHEKKATSYGAEETEKDFQSHEDYINASELDKTRWTEKEAKKFREAGFDKVTGEGLKEGLDSYYSND